MYKFYLTFGQQSAFRNHYIWFQITADNAHEAYAVARQTAFDHFSNRWAKLLPEREFEASLRKKGRGLMRLCGIAQGQIRHEPNYIQED